MRRIPVYQPDLSGNEKKYVDDCIDSTWISSKGKYVSEFEKLFSSYIGTKYAISVNNGTAALHLALMMAGINKEDEVIVPALTYIATANAVTYVGAKAVFVDSDEETWQINPELIIEKISPKTKALIVVHLYGHPCNMRKIVDISKKYGLLLIEDCAEAIGSEYEGKKVGSFGDISCFSYFGNKTMTTGEGGMVLTSDENLYQQGKKLKNQGVEEMYEYWHNLVGYNYRMTNICAAIGCAQMERVDRFISRKKEIAKLYYDYLKDLPVKPHNKSPNVVHTYWMVSILVRDKIERNRMAQFLAGHGVETRPTFCPIPDMPMYKNNENYPVAEMIGACGMNLPSWPGLMDRDVKEICDMIHDFYLKE